MNKCYFCNALLDTDKDSLSKIFYTYECNHHPINVYHAYNRSNLQLITLEKKTENLIYQCLIAMEDLSIIKAGNMELGYLIEDKYKIIYQTPAPPDLTPENFSSYLERIINLKSFL